uniref:HMA domain-containing protein n=1 Tax=Glycine max TaxID=3847 RepID=K7M3A9_SOYBN
MPNGNAQNSRIECKDQQSSNFRRVIIYLIYLLSDWVSESDKIPSHSHKPTLQNQIVVLRVSLHCKARAGKVTKHISKMEGVTSFSIDMEAKKVTIIGHVTPLGVLASVSKVKNAQLWPSSTSSLPSLSSSMPR